MDILIVDDGLVMLYIDMPDIQGTEVLQRSRRLEDGKATETGEPPDRRA